MSRSTIKFGCFFFVFVLVFSFVASAYADPPFSQVEERQKMLGEVPEGCIERPDEFGACPGSYYRLDYVPKKTYGIFTPGESSEEGLLSGINIVYDLGWRWMVSLTTLVIKIYTWAYEVPFIRVMIDALENTIRVFEKWVWKPLWAVMVLWGMVRVVYLFAQRRTRLMYAYLFSIAAISGLAMLLYHDMPEMARDSHENFNGLGKYTLAGMLGFVEIDERPDPTNLEEERLARRQAAEREEVTPAEAELSTKEATKKVQDALHRTLIYEPTLSLNFEDPKKGEKYFKEIAKYGGDKKELRREYLTGEAIGPDGNPVGQKYIDASTGVALNQDFKMMTSDGLGKRTERFLTECISILVLDILFLVLAAWMLWWSCKLLARIFWGGIRLLLAIDPERGWREVVEWVWSVFTASAMKFFIAILLGSVLVFWTAISKVDVSSLDSDWLWGFTAKVLLQILLGGAMFVEFMVVLDRIEITLPGGGSLRLVEWDGFGNVLRRGVFKGIEGFKGLTTSVPKAVAKGTAAYLGRDEMFHYGPMKAIARWRRSQIEANKAQKEFESRGLNPNSKDARMAFLHQMTKEGQRGKALRMLEHLGPVGSVQTGSRIQANLSQDARKLYVEMKEKGFSPLNAEDRRSWLRERPQDGKTMEEITAFSRLPDYRQMIDPPPRDWSYLPPEPPPKNTPEFDLWKKHGYEFMHHQYQKAFDQLEKQRQKEYFAAVENYRRQSKLKQMFSSPPNWKDYAPKTEDVLKYLRENKPFTKDQKS